MKKYFFTLFFCLLAGQFFAQQPNRLSQQIGDVYKVNISATSISLFTKNESIQITANHPQSIHFVVTKTSGSTTTSQSDLALLQVEQNNNDSLIIRTDSVWIRMAKKPFRVAIYNAKQELINQDEPSLGISWFGNQVSCYKKLQDQEKFIGLGEKTGGPNRRGNFYTNWNSDNPGYGNNSDPLYASIPFFIGLHHNLCYGIYFNNSFKSYFNFGGGADEELYHFGADDGAMDYYFFYGNSVSDIIKHYTQITGRTKMPPLWSLGFQQSRWGYNSQTQMLELANQFRTKKIPADVLVSDINYMDNYKVFTWSAQYPNPKQMMDSLSKLGFDMVTIIDPGIKIEKNYEAYETGLKQNYFATYPNGKPYVGHVWPGRCHFPDFLKQSTVNWWGNLLKQAYANNGIRGFWNDMNEPAAWGREFPNLIEFGEGSNKKTLYEVKNKYGLMMAKATYEGATKALQNQRPFVLTRAAFSGIQQYSAVWTGDNVSSDEHYWLGCKLLNSMGVSGIPFIGTDIGGFMGNPSPELFMRWLNTAVYHPLFRNHTHIGYNYREPWQFGEFNTEKIKHLIEERYQLLPFTYALFYEASQNGLPLNRMLPIYYPFDNEVYDSKFEAEFLLGKDVLVCPVSSSKDAAEIYFPEKTIWYRWKEDKEVIDAQQNQKYFAKAPIDNLPVFVKASGIVITQNTVQHTKQQGDGKLYIHLFRGNTDNAFTYYEDDGETYQYESGAFCKRNIIYKAQQQVLLISKTEGTYHSKFNSINIVKHGFNTQTEVVVPWRDNEIEIKL